MDLRKQINALEGRGMRVEGTDDRIKYFCVRCGLCFLDVAKPQPGEHMEIFGEAFPRKCSCGNELTQPVTIMQPIISEVEYRRVRT